MKINVSQKDIDKGERGVENACPIALAVQRAFNTHKVAVYYSSDAEDEDVKELLIRVDTEYYSQKEIDEYEHCDNFIHWFDDGHDSVDGETCCTPFKFNIDTHA